MQYGPGKLSNSELLAILLRTGRRGENAVQLARRILTRFTGARLPHASHTELLACLGIGEAKACEIVAAFELGKRLLKGKKATLHLTPRDVWKALADIRNNKKEQFVVFYLDVRSQEIVREVVSVGTLTSSLVHPREVFEPAVRNLAAYVLIAHNHPSGILVPSEDDKLVTARLAQAGELLGIEVIDHVIVTREGFFSFRESGLL